MYPPILYICMYLCYVLLLLQMTQHRCLAEQITALRSMFDFIAEEQACSLLCIGFWGARSALAF